MIVAAMLLLVALLTLAGTQRSVVPDLVRRRRAAGGWGLLAIATFAGWGLGGWQGLMTLIGIVPVAAACAMVMPPVGRRDGRRR